MELLASQAEQQQAAQQQQMAFEQAKMDAQLRESYSKSANQMATAIERHGRNESNIGLFQERISSVEKNKALATQAKMDAIAKMVDVIEKYGAVETALAEQRINTYDYQNDLKEQFEKQEVKNTAEGNRFVQKILSGIK